MPSQSDLPRVAIMHDSVLNGVQGKRLGQSYGFDAIKRKSSTIEELSETAKVLESGRRKIQRPSANL